MPGPPPADRRHSPRRTSGGGASADARARVICGAGGRRLNRSRKRGPAKPPRARLRRPRCREANDRRGAVRGGRPRAHPRNPSASRNRFPRGLAALRAACGPGLSHPTARAAKRARGGVRGAHPATPAPEERRGNCPCHATRRENKRPPVARRSFGGLGGSLRLRLPALQEQAETEQAQHRRGRLGDANGRPRLRAASGC